MWGGPSHIDTWDPKPDAAAEVRGQFQAIQTSIPGVRISEHFPLLASRAAKYTIVRSMTHTDPAHLSPVHHLLTGHVAAKPNSDADGANRADSPCLGAVVGKVAPGVGPMPTSVTLPWVVSHPVGAGRSRSRAERWMAGGGVRSLSGYRRPERPWVSSRRAEGCGRLVHRAHRRAGEPAPCARSRPKARMTGSPNFGHEPLISCLRRLWPQRSTCRGNRSKFATATAGIRMARAACWPAGWSRRASRMVTVNWPDDNQNFWDTHRNNFPSLKDRLMPPADQGFAALLDDLDARGMLKDTLVVWVGEFGRNPRIDGTAAVSTGRTATRQSWPAAEFMAAPSMAPATRSAPIQPTTLSLQPI